MKKFNLFLVNFACALVKPMLPITVYGKRKYENKKCLIAGNHVCGWDAILITAFTKPMACHAYKAEFQKSWFLRNFFGGLDGIPMRRGEIDLGASKKIISLLNEDKTVCIFPEGTRNPNVDCLQDFRTGIALYALKTHAPIRPFYIWDKTKLFRRNYVIIGDEFTLDEFYDKPISKDVLAQATQVVKDKIDALRLQLNAILQSKGVVRRKRTRKELKKIDAYNKQKALQNNVSQGSENQ